MSTYIQIPNAVADTASYDTLELVTFDGSNQQIAHLAISKNEVVKYKDWKLPLRDNILKGNPARYELRTTNSANEVKSYNGQFPTPTVILNDFNGNHP